VKAVRKEKKKKKKEKKLEPSPFFGIIFSFSLIILALIILAFDRGANAPHVSAQTSMRMPRARSQHRLCAWVDRSH
jgi:hypothetical protein